MATLPVVSRLFAIAIVGLMFALRCGAQGGECRRTIVYVSPLDPAGRPILELHAQQVSAKFKGKPARIVRVMPDTRPSRLFVFLDGSGSMTNERETWALAVKLVESFVNATDTTQRVTLIVFAESVLLRIDSKGRSAELLTGLQGIALGTRLLPGSKGTAIFDTVVSELEKGHDDSVRNMVLVVTDGGDSASRLTVREFENYLLENRTAFSAIAINPFLGTRSRTPEELGGPPEMMNLGEATGGVTAKLENRSETAEFFKDVNRIASAMNLRYAVELETDEPIGKGGKLEMDFVSQPKKRSDRSLLVSPRKLRGCGDR